MAKAAQKVIQNKAIALQRATPVDSTLALIERAARDKTVDVAKMKQLLDMKLEVMRMQRQQEYQQAMCDCQAEMGPVTRQAENKHTKSAYAKLEHISKVIRPIYTKHGFSLTYTSTALADGQRLIVCEVMHRGGHKERHELSGSLDTTGSQGTANKTSIQGLGSTVSYLRRYLTCMIFDVILQDEDDDGQGEPPAAPKPDRFTNNSPIIEGEVKWTEDCGVVVSGKKIQPNFSYVKGRQSLEVQAAGFLKGALTKQKTKQARIDLINENLSLIRALIESNNGSIVSELHALADKGI